MTIDCLMGTYGRHALACEALACFLAQTALPEATFLVYNQHPEPLSFSHPKVRIVNEAPPSGSIRHVRRRMVELSDPAAEFIHFWDDDDLFLPWHLSDCLAHIGDAVAWKPASSWLSERNEDFTLTRNVFESAWMFRADHIRSAPFDTHPTYTEHPVFMQTVDAGLLKTTELGGRASYIYRWANGAQHLSGYGGVADQETQAVYIEWWRRRSTDVAPDGRLVPADLTPRWRRFLDATRGMIPDEDWERNRRDLGL